MWGASTSRVVVALSLLSVAACGPGRLPDLGFGTAADGASETAASTDPSTGPGDDDEPTTATTVAEDESASEELPGDGDGDEPTTTDSSSTLSTSGDGDGDGEGEGEGEDENEGEGEGEGEGDGDEGDDTWGIPPDVTNEPCEPLTQDCFPTHKCVPFATQPNSNFLDANKCMPILGDQQWGQPCVLSSFQEGQDDCDGDGFCWNLEWVQGQLHGTCVPFCVGTPQNLMCPLGWGCSFSGAVSLCNKQCDPLAQDCPNFFGCYWGGNNFQCLLTSTPAGANQTCEKVAECMPGLACVNKALVPGCVGNDINCCTPWCSLSAPDCAPQLECVAFFDDPEAPPWLANIGVCIQ